MEADKDENCLMDVKDLNFMRDTQYCDDEILVSTIEEKEEVLQPHESLEPEKNVVLELARVLKATEQVVAGKLYRLTREVIEAGEKKIYEAKVWVKPWMNFKQFQEFKNVIPSFTISDLGLKSGKQL
ncbi:unnamed protein product [Arabidopsis arenosa]|uniref:Cysteine proteinase inhibitor n=1 Tax=Arabidopsis arenosa TaxID=38785 RepID=A0A8S1ZFS4_ARAAE|nr:unnamed protein product [Arabidopsis arenosa]